MSTEKKENTKKTGYRFRMDIVIFVAVFVLLVTFCAYMMNTGLEETLYADRGESIVTHDYTYDDSSVSESK